MTIASKGGAPTHPDWDYNIPAYSMVTVEVGPELVQASTALASEAERTCLYEPMVSAMPGFAEYRRKTSRAIPVKPLTPVK